MKACREPSLGNTFIDIAVSLLIALAISPILGFAWYANTLIAQRVTAIHNLAYRQQSLKSAHDKPEQPYFFLLTTNTACETLSLSTQQRNHINKILTLSQTTSIRLRPMLTRLKRPSAARENTEGYGNTQQSTPPSTLWHASAIHLAGETRPCCH